MKIDNMNFQCEECKKICDCDSVHATKKGWLCKRCLEWDKFERESESIEDNKPNNQQGEEK